MAIRQLNPYINFNGTAEQAIQLYERALGARAENVKRFSEAEGMPVAPADKNRVLHAVLKVDACVFMLSDSIPGQPVPTDGNITMTLDFDDAADMARRFDALSAGGTVTMPLADTFWGAKFGMLTDAFGVRWMFNCETKKS